MKKKDQKKQFDKIVNGVIGKMTDFSDEEIFQALRETVTVVEEEKVDLIADTPFGSLSSAIDAAEVRKNGAELFVRLCESPNQFIQEMMDIHQIERGEAAKRVVYALFEERDQRVDDMLASMSESNDRFGQIFAEVLTKHVHKSIDYAMEVTPGKVRTAHKAPPKDN